MDHVPAMHVGQRLQNLAHQGDAAARVELMGIAEAVDGQAADEFHHQIGQAGLGDAAIDQARDLRMIQAGQELAFAAEALFDLVARPAPAAPPSRPPTSEGAVGAFGQINGAHAAAPEQLHGLPRAEPRQSLGARGHGGTDAFVIFEQAEPLRCAGSHRAPQRSRISASRSTPGGHSMAA